MTSIISKIRNMCQSLMRTRIDIQKLEYTIKHDALIEKTLHSTEPGTTEARLCDEEIIVSLTTYGKRLYDVAVTIESIMQGSMKPNRIVLWLDNSLKGTTLPIALQNQMRRGLQVGYVTDLLSYKKLVPALREYPDATVITIDDDAIYHYDLVEKLVNKHISAPRCIVANRIHRVVLDKDNRPVTYMRWKWQQYPDDASFLNFQTGGGGVLYPPHSLAPEVTDERTFMDICKYADDVWFYAMALKAGTPVVKCPTHSPQGNEYITNLNVQSSPLNKINVSDTSCETCANDTQLKAVFDRYNLWNKLVPNSE